MERERMLDEVAHLLLDRLDGGPLRIGVDGVCGAGKTTFAHELAARLAALGAPAVHVDSDGFHAPRAVRHRQGRDSARGYYEDAYDLDGLRDRVLVPLGPGGSRRYATHLHDLQTDVVEPRFAVAPADAVLLFAATFIQRGALRDHWDEVIWLDVPEAVAQRRGAARDASALGGIEAARAAYERRYMAACRLYLAEEHPRDRASIVIDHTDPAAPRLLRPPPGAAGTD